MRVTFPVIVLSLVLAPVARAGFIFTSGNMHATASATSGAVTTSSNPPDQPMFGLFGSHSATTSANGVNGTATSSAGIGSNSVPSNLVLYGNTQVTRSSQLLFNGSSFASGVMNFNFTGAATLGTEFTFTGSAGGASVSIKDAANNTVFSQSKSGPNDPVPPNSTVSFVPGAYTLNWSVSGFPVAFTGGSTFFTWQTVPEPASLALPALPALVLARRRR